MINIQEKKNKILEFLQQNGPSLPVQIARTISMDPVFASAILSELINSKQVTTSHMRVGSSPLYLLPTQFQQLERKTEHLKQVEKEAQEKLRKEKILYDEQESPSTRVALRNIKDFAKPSKENDKIIWQYAFSTSEEIKEKLEPKKPEEDIQDTPKAWESKKEEINKIRKEQKKPEEIFEKKPEFKEKPKTFLQEIENFLKQKETEIISIEKVDKKEVIAKIKSPNQTSMLFAFNRLRITESELLTCYKKAKKNNLPYKIITKGKLTKKLQETINAYQNLQATYQLKNS